MSNVNDSIQAVCKFGEKFTDVLARGANGLYKPKQIRKISKATAESMTEIAEALRLSADVIKDKDLGILFERALYRATFNDILTEQNIGMVLEKASAETNENELCSSEEVQQDWITRFFNYAGAVSDDDMQTLWAKILAGEIKKPKSYSLRTLDTLRNLSKEEALTFNKLQPLILRRKQKGFVVSNLNTLKKYGITYDDLLLLEECGLLLAKSSTSVKMDISENETQIFLEYHKTLIGASIKSKQSESIKLGVYCLTTAGAELSSLVDEQNEDYISEVIEMLSKNDKIELTIFKVKENSNDQL